MKQIINQGLEDGGSIGQSEGHHQILTMSARRVESGLPLISLSDLPKVVFVEEAKLGKDQSSLEKLGQG